MTRLELKAEPDTEMRDAWSVNRGDVVVLRALGGLISGYAQVWWTTTSDNWWRILLSNGQKIDVNSDTTKVEVLI